MRNRTKDVESQPLGALRERRSGPQERTFNEEDAQRGHPRIVRCRLGAKVKGQAFRSFLAAQ